MFFKPKWYNSLPDHLKPISENIEKLEELRKKLDFSHELFLAGIANSRWAVIRAQEATLEKLRQTLPNATDKELWRGVLFTRYEIKLKCPSPLDPPRNVILQEMQNLDKAMLHINSFKELINYILRMEKANLMDLDPIQKQIDEILFE